MLPLLNPIIWREMGKPIPLPSSLVVKKGTKILEAISGGIGRPSLVTSMTTRSSASEHSCTVLCPKAFLNSRILILCTGNSCRSQMAHGFMQSFDDRLEVCSAGTVPAECVHPLAVKVMNEVGIDISAHTPQSVQTYLDASWDYVITVCGGANESCPVFRGKVEHRLHIGFDDPSKMEGSAEFVLSSFRRVRDEIKQRFYELYLCDIMR